MTTNSKLATPLTLQRKRARITEKKGRVAKAKADAAQYQKLLSQRLKKQRERKSESVSKKRSSAINQFIADVFTGGGFV